MIEPRAEMAIQLRISLLEVIAPDCRCALCGAVCEIEDLEVDHANGCTYDKRRLSAWGRAARYWDEHAAGVPLRAACRGCNARDGVRRFQGERRRYRRARRTPARHG